MSPLNYNIPENCAIGSIGMSVAKVNHFLSAPQALDERASTKHLVQICLLLIFGLKMNACLQVFEFQKAQARPQLELKSQQLYATCPGAWCINFKRCMVLASFALKT